MATQEFNRDPSTGKFVAADQELRTLYDAQHPRIKLVAVTPKARVIPWTIKMLQDLGPGEKLTYYKGNFTTDIIDCGEDYRRLLTEIRDFAKYLEYRGKVVLSQEAKRIASGNGMTTINLYVATGV